MIYRSKIEKFDTQEIVDSQYINWEFFNNSSFLVTGATGLIGSKIIDSLMLAKKNLNLKIKIYALVRNENKARKMFPERGINFIVQDINEKINLKKSIDYIVHCANTTSSKEMTEHPVETILSIVKGTENVLEFAKQCKIKSMVYLSSMEIYGDIPLSKEEPLKEEDYGYINILKPRSSYPQAKKMAESLCSCYAKEYNVPVKIARLSQTIGANVDYNDNRVFVEFARNIVEHKDIVLKTKGETTRSYIYVTDAVSAILCMLEKGKNGESYNVSNPSTTCSIKELAEMLSKRYSNNIVMNIDDKNNPTTTKYYLSTIKYYLDTTKYYLDTGWKPEINIEKAFSRLINSFMYVSIPKGEDNLFQKLKKGIKKKDKIKKVFKDTRKFFYEHLLSKTYVKKNRIIFNNFGGKGYGCNPKYIAEEILKRNLPYEIFWMCKDEDLVRQQGLPSKIKTTGFDNIKGISSLFSSKIIVSNVHLNALINKGWEKTEKQKYIQTWHGSLGIKKIDKSVHNDKNKFFTENWKTNADKDIEYTDYLLSNSDFEDNVFKEGLSWNKDFLKFGHPRNDIFFYSKEVLRDIKEKVFKKYNIEPSKKICLYAPSYRDNKNIDVYNINTTKLIKNLNEKYGSEWIIMTRLHPNLVNTKLMSKLFCKVKNVIDASTYPDIQELLVSADIGITDYSSWIFDFMLSKKPAFIYAEDFEEYNTDRGFYYSLETTPFPIAQNNDELVENIRNFDNEKYKKEVDVFLKEKGCIEDGHASERVVDFIEKVIFKG